MLGGCAEYDLRIAEGFLTSADISCSQGSVTGMLLSGMLVEANETGKATVWYSCSTTNSYFGVVSTGETKSLTAEFAAAEEKSEETPEEPQQEETKE